MLDSNFDYDDMDKDPDYEADSNSDKIKENGNVYMLLNLLGNEVNMNEIDILSDKYICFNNFK